MAQKADPSSFHFQEKRMLPIVNRQASIDKIWALGGKNGMYYANWLWEMRAALDKLIGGIGMRPQSQDKQTLVAGDTLNFWRVKYANKKEGRLRLLAEIKLPGEALLEWEVNQNTITQLLTFKPSGIAGRLYWYAALPFHRIIFQGMIKELANADD